MSYRCPLDTMGDREVLDGMWDYAHLNDIQADRLESKHYLQIKSSTHTRPLARSSNGEALAFLTRVPGIELLCCSYLGVVA